MFWRLRKRQEFDPCATGALYEHPYSCPLPCRVSEEEASVASSILVGPIREAFGNVPAGEQTWGQSSAKPDRWPDSSSEPPAGRKLTPRRATSAVSHPTTPSVVGFAKPTLSATNLQGRFGGLPTMAGGVLAGGRVWMAGVGRVRGGQVRPLHRRNRCAEEGATRKQGVGDAAARCDPRYSPTMLKPQSTWIVSPVTPSERSLSR